MDDDTEVCTMLQTTLFPKRSDLNKINKSSSVSQVALKGQQEHSIFDSGFKMAVTAPDKTSASQPVGISPFRTSLFFLGVHPLSVTHPFYLYPSNHNFITCPHYEGRFEIWLYSLNFWSLHIKGKEKDVYEVQQALLEFSNTKNAPFD